jgi:hypothetical protein
MNFTANVTDNLGITNTTLNFYNDTSLVNQTTFYFTKDTVTQIIGIFIAIIPDNIYTWFFEVRDWANNLFISQNNTLTIDTTAPVVSEIISNTPQGYGYNISINATVIDEFSSIDSVLVQITFPNSTATNFSMNNIFGDIYNYELSDTWQLGEHNYTIYAIDDLGNKNISIQNSFNISISATISIETIDNSYGLNEWVNLTDPPSSLIQGIDSGLFFGNSEDIIPVIIEFEDIPLTSYDKLIGREVEGNMNSISIQQSNKNEKLRTYSLKISNEHNQFINTLKKDYKYELKVDAEYKSVMNGLAIKVKRKDLENIKNLPNVKAIWEDTNLSVLMQDSVPLINADNVWVEQNSSGSNITGLGIKVAIIDTGIAYDHLDLGNCTTTQFTSGT